MSNLFSETRTNSKHCGEDRYKHKKNPKTKFELKYIKLYFPMNFLRSNSIMIVKMKTQNINDIATN